MVMIDQRLFQLPTQFGEPDWSAANPVKLVQTEVVLGSAAAFTSCRFISRETDQLKF